MAVLEDFDLKGSIRALSPRRRPSRRGGSDKQLKLAISVAELTLLTGVAVVAALTFWALFAPLPTAKRLPVPVRETTIVDAVATVALNPFRQTSAPEIMPALEEGPDIAETSLDLTLHGTWVDSEGGSAIIRTPDNKQKLIREGDAVWNSVTLERVERDQVVIRTNGVQESIRLLGSEPRSQPVQSRPGAAPSQRAALNATNILNGIDFALEKQTGEKPTGAPRLAISGGSPAVLSQLGLKVGDKLLEVNGSPIGADPLPIMEQMQSLGSGEGVEVTIERDGLKQTVRLNVGQTTRPDADDVLRE